MAVKELRNPALAKLKIVNSPVQYSRMPLALLG